MVIRECDGEVAVHLRGATSQHGFVTFGVEISGSGPRAETYGVTADGTVGDLSHDLDAFVRQLAEGFRGWPGARSWSALSGNLTVIAEHRPGGHVDLTWTIGSTCRQGAARWNASVVITVDAGEDMRHLAADLQAFLHSS